ncbi:hypothetical protein TELCIR_03949 [Teladorsagia circumcincta]|uniref:Uncharacterized protein n=1 Tax=Teladorsagia circumcincta TaxID=45464 RepID=A0A2G9UV69_TELCI|nr:hypothetical protein TELCIR_03949 [Teladorsagia circumcincta]
MIVIRIKSVKDGMKMVTGREGGTIRRRTRKTMGIGETDEATIATGAKNARDAMTAAKKRTKKIERGTETRIKIKRTVIATAGS